MQILTHFIHEEPAMRWEDGIPLGNGFLGAMVYGHTAKEKIQLNEDSLWYGKEQNRINPKAGRTFKRNSEAGPGSKISRSRGENVLLHGICSI